MNTFFLIGIIVNVILTGLALYWVLRNMRSRGESPRDGND